MLRVNNSFLNAFTRGHVIFGDRRYLCDIPLKRKSNHWDAYFLGTVNIYMEFFLTGSLIGGQIGVTLSRNWRFLNIFFPFFSIFPPLSFLIWLGGSKYGCIRHAKCEFGMAVGGGRKNEQWNFEIANFFKPFRFFRPPIRLRIRFPIRRSIRRKPTFPKNYVSPYKSL